MHILITDSGVGGLSVVAYAEQFVRTHRFSEPVQLTFANAAPENDYGYNSMPSREVKIETFDRFLRNVTSRFAPDLIYVACNTLSVLLPDTPFFSIAPTPVKGIVETGVSLVWNELQANPRSVAMIFGTQTTIDSEAHSRMLQARGIDPSRIVTQACPGLADTISEDREGRRSRLAIENWVAAATQKMGQRDVPVIACLACTHYGYRKEMFVAALVDAGLTSIVINPNQAAVDDIFDESNDGEPTEAEVRVVSRYAIPAATLETLSFFLGAISPRTVEALQRFEHHPHLF